MAFPFRWLVVLCYTLANPFVNYFLLKIFNVCGLDIETKIPASNLVFVALFVVLTYFVFLPVFLADDCFTSPLVFAHKLSLSHFLSMTDSYSTYYAYER
jgi:hypothetical protein